MLQAAGQESVADRFQMPHLSSIYRRAIHDIGGAGPIYAAARAPQGRRYFSDEFHHRVVVEDPSGWRWNFGTLGSGPGEFRHPRGLAILPGQTDEDSLVFVCDSRNHRVQVFDGNGRFRLAFGGEGHGEGQLDTPSDIAIVNLACPGEELDENAPAAAWVAVADRGNNRVQVFEPDGVLVGVCADPAMWFPVRLSWKAPWLDVVSATGQVLSVDLARAVSTGHQRTVPARPVPARTIASGWTDTTECSDPGLHLSQRA